MTALSLAALAALIALNAAFVAAEFALVRSRAARLDGDARSGRAARRALADPGSFLAACQVGVTMCSIAIGFVGEPVIAGLIEPLLGGPAGRAAAAVLSLLAAYAVITAVHITAGEQAPKLYAISRPERVLAALAGPVGVFLSALRPAVRALSWATAMILRPFGVDADAAHDAPASQAEIQALISGSARDGQLDAGEARMLRGVFRLHEKHARNVMTPAPDLVSVADDASAAQALQACADSGRSRLLVVRASDPGTAVGTVSATRLAGALLGGGPDAPISPLIFKAPMVPETKPLDDLLAMLQAARSSLAIVLDEYGRAAGVVSVEDIVEEAVGEIDDETDARGRPVRRTGPGSWQVDGSLSLSDLPAYGLDLGPGREGASSVGGLVFSLLGRLPLRGDTVAHAGHWLTVEAMDGSRISQVAVARVS